MSSATHPRIVFDFGVVLFRWRPEQVVAQAWPHRAEPPALLRQTVADCFQAYGGDWGLFDQGLIDEHELARRMHTRMGWPPQEVLHLVAVAAQELQPQPQVLALLQRLQARGHRLSYLSNMPAVLAASLEARYPLHEWFESGVFSSRVGLCKPAPAIYAKAEQVYGEAAQDCLLIDDMPANVQAAQSCGWQAELFTGAQALEAALRTRGLVD